MGVAVGVGVGVALGVALGVAFGVAPAPVHAVATISSPTAARLSIGSASH
jgi:hypothetical protein